jgi:hypothetical protein
MLLEGEALGVVESLRDGPLTAARSAFNDSSMLLRDAFPLACSDMA